MKKINFSVEQWNDMINPIWYRCGKDNYTLEFTDLSLARRFSNEIETLGRIRRVDVLSIFYSQYIKEKSK